MIQLLYWYNVHIYIFWLFTFHLLILRLVGRHKFLRLEEVFPGRALGEAGITQDSLGFGADLRKL